MKPYYEEKGITIYCGDCREVLPELGIYDLLLTDPPYGIGNWKAGCADSILTEAEAAEIQKWDIKPSMETLNLCLRSSCKAIIWGGNYFALGPARTLLIWDKQKPGMQFADAEIAWTNLEGLTRIWAGRMNGKQHPTEKPVALMKWCIAKVPWVKGVLDPFMGNGSSLVAAKAMGLRGIGIEKNEKWCELTRKRLKQETLYQVEDFAK